MVEDTKETPEQEGAVATEESPATSEEARTDAGEPEDKKPKPIRIARSDLTAESKEQAEQDSGKPVEDIPYELKGEENTPHSILNLKFEVAAEVFQKEIDTFYNRLRKDVTLPGFRKGKAPVKLIRIRMGEDADRDAMSDVAANVLRQEVLKRDGKLTDDDPNIVAWNIEEGQPLTFEVDIEVVPVVDLKQYRELEVTVEAHEVDEKDVEAELERMQNAYETLEPAPEATTVAESGVIVIDLKVTGESGNELKHLGYEDRTIYDYKKELPAEIVDAIGKLKVGETAEAAVKTSRTNRRAETIEHTDTHAVKIKAIKVPKRPKLDDEFAKDMGEYDTIAKLREATKKDLIKQSEEQLKSRSVARLIQAIIENNPFDAPLSLIAQTEYQAMLRDSYQLQRVGLKLDNVVKNPGEYYSKTHEDAVFQIKLTMVMDELAKTENLEVGDEDLEKEIAEMAESAGRKPLAIRANLEAENKLDDLRRQILHRKVSEFLIENNKIEKVKPAEIDEEAEKTPDSAAEDKKDTKSPEPDKQ